ncbi:MAG: response regulator [Rhodospirillum sp.]|nr:response regulator [Rhodospirillum sp.]MCF8489751.1 response regulator [Rhodospirillum sp.]MCF8502473.1 response regulator [Rhodospirillum sp.]
MFEPALDGALSPVTASLVGTPWTALPLSHQPLFLACLAMHLALARTRSLRWHQSALVIPALLIALAMAMHFLVAVLPLAPKDEILAFCEMVAAAAALYSASLSVLSPTAESDRHAAEEKLRQSTMQLTAASRVARFCRFSVDLDSKRITWSTEALPLFGWSAFDDSLPTTLDSLIALLHQDDQGPVRKAVARATAMDHPFEFQARLRRGQGRDVPIHALSDIVRSPDGKGIALHGIVQDVSPMKAALEREARTRAEFEAAKRSNATKTAFISNMSHELRTPLNAIIGYSELLSMRADGMTPDKVRSDLANVLQASHHLLDLINDILDMAKIESGQMELDPSTFTTREVFDETIALIKPLLDANGNNLVLSGDVLSHTLTTDRMKLRQCLVNLAGNAAKFTQNGTIILSADQTADGMLSLSVDDTGIGLSAKQSENLFTAFHQGDRFTAATYGGTGLGLAITKAFCHLMGGRISFDSTPGLGSRFTMNLPILSRPVGLTHPDGPVPDAKPLDALIVEDDRSYGDLLARLVTQGGRIASVARTAEQALDITAFRPPRLLIADLILPDMDGFELIRRLRKQRPTRMNILALTSLDLTRNQKDELELAGVEILLKRDTTLSQAGDRALTILDESASRALSQVSDTEEM